MNEFMECVMAKLEEIKRSELIGAKDVLTIQECSLLTGFTVKTLYGYIHQRRIPHYKAVNGKTVFFSKAEVERWMKGVRVPTNEEIESRAETRIAIGRLRKRRTAGR